MSLLLNALFVGLLATLAEIAIVSGRAVWLQNGLIRRSPHWVWMLATTQMGLFLCLGVVLVVASRLSGGRSDRLSRTVILALGMFVVLLNVSQLSAISSLIASAGLAAWLGPWIAGRSPQFRRRGALALIGVLAIPAAALPVRLHRPAQPRPRSIATAPKNAPSVLLIVMDTVRYDATSLHDQNLGTTPRLKQFAERGAVFQRAIATAPWTLPSHASMFTGRWAWQLALGPDQRLDDRFPTVAQQFREHGYATAGFVANTVFCTAEYGLGNGFDHYEDYPMSAAEVLRSSAAGWLLCKGMRWGLDRALTALGHSPRHPFEFDADRKTAAEMNRSVLRWLDQTRGKPSFVFMNYIDAHDPYLLPAGEAWPLGNEPRTLTDHQILRRWIGLPGSERTPERVALARDAYHNCVAYLDGQIGKLLDELDRRGVLENTIVVITSDHGEHFGEHKREEQGLFGHRASLFQQEIGVPLLIVAPGQIDPLTIVADPVSLRDLPATMLDLAGIKRSSGIPGESLSRMWCPLRSTSDSNAHARPVISEFASKTTQPVLERYLHGASGLMRAVVSGSYTLHFDDRGKASLFDLADDPEELQDLAGTEQGGPISERLGKILDAETGRVPVQ